MQGTPSSQGKAALIIRSSCCGKPVISLCKFLWVGRRGAVVKLPITLLLLKEIKRKKLTKGKRVRRIKDLITVSMCCPGCGSC